MWCLLALALGNIAASRPDPAVGSSLAAGPTPVQVLDEELIIDCEAGPICEFTARYSVLNPTAEVQEVTASFVGEHVSPVKITSDGKLRFEPGQRAEVVAQGQLAPGRFRVPSYARAALEVRHPLFGDEVPRTQRFDLEYRIAPIRTWAGPPPAVRVTLKHPPQWRVTVYSVAGDDTGLLGDGPYTLDAAKVDRLLIALEVQPQRLFHGGPLFGVGGTIGQGFRARFGYEVAAPEWLLLSLAAETDFVHTVLVVPVVQAVSDSLLGVVPSLGGGLGIPVLIVPGVRVGARAQVTARWQFVGLLAALDVFPTASQVLQVTLMGEVGL